MKTILIFPFNLLSHYLRCLVLADSYDKTKFNILFLKSSKYDQYVDQYGYQTFSCQQFDAEYVMACAGKFDFSWLNYDDVEQIMLAQVDVIKKYKADMVIGDVAPTLKMAAELTGVKHISLMNGYMTKYYAATRKLSRRHSQYQRLKRLPEPVFEWITNVAERVAFRRIHRPFKQIRKKYTLKPLADYLLETEGEENLICDDQQLFPQKSLPENYKFIGPLIYDNYRDDEQWLYKIDQHNPVICVCMGSSGDWFKLDFLNDAYFAKYTIIAAGDTQKVLSAPHIISKDFVNLNNVLKITDLLICHGGNGTVYTGIKNQIFMLCLSSHFEQEWNISALEKKGYGKSADDFNIHQWKIEINRAINHKLHCLIPQ